jgi:hypothetical protein
MAVFYHPMDPAPLVLQYHPIYLPRRLLPQSSPKSIQFFPFLAALVYASQSFPNQRRDRNNCCCRLTEVLPPKFVPKYL